MEEDDVDRVSAKEEMQFMSMTQKLLEGGELALVYFGTSVVCDYGLVYSLWSHFSIFVINDSVSLDELLMFRKQYLFWTLISNGVVMAKGLVNLAIPHHVDCHSHISCTVSFTSSRLT